MKIIIKVLLISIPWILLTGSCRKDCICTARGCEPAVPYLIFTANYEEDELRHFSTEELNAFFLIRSNRNYEAQDSIRMNFRQSSGTVPYKFYFRFDFYKHPDIIDMRNLNLLIKNRILHSVDTIVDVEYSEEIVSKLCNICSGPCPDKYIEDIHYSEYRLKHNGQIIEDFNIALCK